MGATSRADIWWYDVGRKLKKQSFQFSYGSKLSIVLRRWMISILNIYNQILGPFPYWKPNLEQKAIGVSISNSIQRNLQQKTLKGRSYRTRPVWLDHFGWVLVVTTKVGSELTGVLFMFFPLVLWLVNMSPPDVYPLPLLREASG